MEREILHLAERLKRLLDRAGVKEEDLATLDLRLDLMERRQEILKKFLGFMVCWSSHSRRDAWEKAWEEEENYEAGLRLCEGAPSVWHYHMTCGKWAPERTAVKPGESTYKQYHLCDECFAEWDFIEEQRRGTFERREEG